MQRPHSNKVVTSNLCLANVVVIINNVFVCLYSIVLREKLPYDLRINTCFNRFNFFVATNSMNAAESESVVCVLHYSATQAEAGKLHYNLTYRVLVVCKHGDCD